MKQKRNHNLAHSNSSLFLLKANYNNNNIKAIAIIAIMIKAIIKVKLIIVTIVKTKWIKGNSTDDKNINESNW